MRKDKKGDGFSCLSGEKVLCRTCSYAKLPPTSATTPTRSTGILRPDPSGLGDDKTRSTVRSFDRFSTSTTRKYFGWETGTTRRSFTDYPDRDTTWKRATNRFETDRTTNWGSESKRPTGRFEPTASPGTAGGVDDCHSVWIGLTPDCNGWCPDGWNIVGKSNTGPGWTCKTGQKFRCQKCDKDSGAAVVSQENRNGHIKASG